MNGGLVRDDWGDRRVYGDWFDDDMRARMKRDKDTWATQVVMKQRHYAVRGYINDSADDHNVHFYYKRRDGRVQMDIRPRADVLEYGEEITP